MERASNHHQKMASRNQTRASGIASGSTRSWTRSLRCCLSSRTSSASWTGCPSCGCQSATFGPRATFKWSCTKIRRTSTDIGGSIPRTTTRCPTEKCSCRHSTVS
ncbi:uncharacterized protein LOC119193770 [Manduca sexta]|uniref:uncharacterized protein LOC119193770 n=1 Tax=Manduca sexta TaxID=7130 RepID=UPI00188EB4E0|nr:uncharacterized protein LOC119193770 [Manduca sexta]